MSKHRCVMYLGAAVAACVAGQVRAEALVAPPLSLDPSVLTLAEEASEAPAFLSDEWIDQVKHPMEGVAWGADQRIRLTYYNNAVTLNQQAARHEVNFFRYRTRIWLSLSPMENLVFNMRLQWEGRHYQNPQPPEWYNGQCAFDIANFKLTVPQLATTWLVGRQEIILGDGWLVLDGTPLDGSTTLYLDAVRSTTNLADLNTLVDLMYIQEYSSPDHWLPSLGDTDRPLTENDERGAIVYVTNKSIPNVELNPYFIYKHDRAVLPAGDNADIYTVGARVVDAFTENLKGKIEGAYQFGVQDGERLSAWGVVSHLSYSFNDAMSNELRLNFEYLSGDNPNSAQNEQFNPLWGRFPQWSELYVYTYVRETALSYTTNLIRVGPEYVVKPVPNMEIDLRYNALFANSNGLAATSPMINEDGYFRGHLFSAIMRYKFNNHIAAHLWTEYLVPGNYYVDSNRDNAIFFRAELYLTF